MLAGLWVTAVAAQWGALRPVISQEHVTAEEVLLHVVGASFAACGLLAWYRRPDRGTGRLMVLTGFLFFARPLLRHQEAALQSDSPAMLTWAAHHLREHQAAALQSDSPAIRSSRASAG